MADIGLSDIDQTRTSSPRYPRLVAPTLALFGAPYIAASILDHKISDLPVLFSVNDAI